jgi:hypothetical protein
MNKKKKTRNKYSRKINNKNNKSKKNLNKSKRSNIKYNDSKKLTGGTSFFSLPSLPTRSDLKLYVMRILKEDEQFEKLYQLAEHDNSVIDFLFDSYEDKYGRWFTGIKGAYAISHKTGTNAMKEALKLINIDKIKKKIKERNDSDFKNALNEEPKNALNEEPRLYENVEHFYNVYNNVAHYHSRVKEMELAAEKLRLEQEEAERVAAAEKQRLEQEEAERVRRMMGIFLVVGAAVATPLLLDG